MVAELPPPPVPADADLTHYDDMPLEVRRLRDSGIAGEANAEIFRCAVLLWCVAWHQVPAGSLPMDDAELCRLVGLGRDLKTWKKVKGGVLRGWRRFADGRLYHRVVAEKVIDGWNGTLLNRWGKECDRIRKENKAREKKKDAPLEFPRKPDVIPMEWPPTSDSFPAESRKIPPENGLNRIEGNGMDVKDSAAAESGTGTAPARADGKPTEKPAARPVSQAVMARQELLDATFAQWAAVAYELRISDPGFANGERRIAQAKILDEIPGIEVWQVALQKLREAEFLRKLDGTPKRFVNFAWFCDPEHFTGLLEDRYRDRDVERSTSGPSNARAIYEGAMSVAGKQPLKGILDA